MSLMSLQERVNVSKSPLFKGKFTQQDDFIDIIKGLVLPTEATALSVSTGDGMWDYLTFQNNPSIKRIIATDIVNNPVKPSDEAFLRSKGGWEFVKVEPESGLPFSDEKFDLIFHQDVIEHVQTPLFFLKEQHRVLKQDGILVLGTPNLFRPVNILKLLLGRLRFPVKIGHNEDIGDYVHIQEFYEQQMNVLLKEVGFRNISVCHSFWGISFLHLAFSKHPKGNLGKSMAHYLTFKARK